MWMRAVVGAAVCVAVALAGCGSEGGAADGVAGDVAGASDAAAVPDVHGDAPHDAEDGAAPSDSAEPVDSVEPIDSADVADADDSGAPDSAPDGAPDAEADTADAGGDAAPDSAADTGWDVAIDSATIDSATVDSATIDSATIDSATVDSATDAGPPPCLPTTPTTEVCDGLDNDCDGATDVASDEAPPLCADGNVCTADTCAGAAGCKFPPAQGGKGPVKCDDGDPCTGGDACSAGVCMAGGAACADANPCTADACDAKTGACSHTPIPNCKACKAVTDCADANDCTTDTCPSGTCVWKPITGCIGPTDPTITEITLAAKVLQAPGAVTAKLWIENLGKPIIYGAQVPTSLQVELYHSQDAALDAGDSLASTFWWTNKAVGAPYNIKSYMDIAFHFEDLAKVKPGPQFVCARLKGGGDVNLANNDACVPIDVKVPAWKLISLQVPEGDVFNKAEFYVTIKVQSGAITDQKLLLGVYLSLDDTWDAKDTKLLPPYDNPGFGIGTVKAGAEVIVSPKATMPVKAAPGKPWICVVLAPATYQFEENKADNILCKQMVNVRNPADIGVAASNIGFTVTGAFVGNPVYGQPYHCMLKQVVNYGDLPVTTPIATQCWVDVAGANFPGTAGWSVAWSIPANAGLGAGYWQNNAQKAAFVNNILSGYGAAPSLFRPNHLGVSHVCAHLNHDGAQDEVALKNNKLCMKITITGHDLYPDAPWTWIGGTLPVNNIKLKRGVPYPMQFRVCNKGNADLPNPAKLKTRIVLDQDGKATATDPVIYTGTGIPGYTKIPGHSQYAPGCVNLALTDKVTLPATLAPGSYVMVLDVNHDQAYPDPESDNVAKGLTIVVE